MNKITFFLFLIITLSGFSLFAQDNGPGGVGGDSTNRFWFIADQLELTDGSNVSSWENLGGNSLDAISNGSSPLYVENFSNGLAGINFGIGINAGFTIDDTSDLNSGGPFSERTFSIAIKTSANITDRQIIYEEGAGTRGLNIYISNGSLYYGAWNLANSDGSDSPWGFSSVSTAVSSNTNYILTYVFKGNDSKTGTIECYLNGDLVGEIPNVGRLYAHQSAAIGNASGGTYGESGSISGNFSFDGIIAEFIMYNYGLNNSERISVENYLSSKYDIALAANDIYSQDVSSNGDFDFNLVSINKKSNTDQHLVTNQGTGLVSLSTSSAINDDEFFSMGSDFADQTSLNLITCNPTGKDVSRLQATWRVNKSTAITPNVIFDFSTINGNVVDVDDIQILIDNDPTFSSATALNASVINANTAEFQGLSINDGDYITFELNVNRTIPNTVAGLNLKEQERFRFEANKIDQTDGSDVSVWFNLVQNNENASVQTNAPSLVKDFTNGQDFLQFNSANSESLEIPNNPDINDGGEPYSKRTYSVVFQTGPDVNARQVIYEEGGTTRGVVIYILNGNVYFGAYNDSNDGPGSPWSFKSVNAGLDPNTTYVMTNVFSGNDSTSGTIESFLNGKSIGVVTNVGLLYDHTANISIGQNGDGNIYESGSVSNESYFGGYIGEFLIYNVALNENQVDLLNNNLQAKYGINPSANDIYAYDFDSNGNFDFNMIGVRETSTSRIDSTTYDAGVIKLKNPSSLDLGDALLVASDVQDQTTVDLSSVDCSNELEDNLRLNAIWRVGIIGSPGSTDIELAYKNLDFPISDSSELELIIADNPNFNNPVSISASDFCSTAVFKNVSFNEGDYFTFERKGLQPVVWDGANYINGSGSSNDPTLADKFKKLIINAPGASIVEDAACSCLVISNGADLSVDNFNLSVGQDVVNNGQLTGDGEVILNGESPQAISGLGSYENLRLDNTTFADINDITDLFGVLYVDQGTLNTNGNLKLRCRFNTEPTPPQTAQVAEVNGTIVGDVTAEQCYPAKRAFRLLTSSVSTSTSIRVNWQENAGAYDDTFLEPGYGTHITGVMPGPANAVPNQDNNKGFDYNPSGNPSMFTFDNIGRKWEPIDSTLITLTAGDPYRLMIRGDRFIDITDNETDPSDTRLRAKGVLQIGSYSFSNLSEVAGNLSLIANPYHAQVNMNSVLNSTGTTNLSTSEYYIWDPTLGGANGRGAYVTVALPAGSNSVSSEANQYLQPMQAAFVKTVAIGPAEINFEESFKDVTPDQTRTKSLSDPEYINIQLFDAQSYAEGSTASDGLRINFNDAYSSSIKDDSPKLGNLDENLLRIEGSKGISIERRPMPEGDEKLDLFVNQYRSEAYVMKFNMTDNLNTKVYIEDKYLDELTEITKTNNTYSFSVDGSISESTATDRFSLVLNPVSLSTPDEKLLSLSLYPNPTAGKFSISGQDLAQGAEFQIYNMLGQQVYKRNIEGQSTVEIRDFNVNAGLYLVKVKTSQGERTFKLIKE